VVVVGVVLPLHHRIPPIVLRGVSDNSSMPAACFRRWEFFPLLLLLAVIFPFLFAIPCCCLSDYCTRSYCAYCCWCWCWCSTSCSSCNSYTWMNLELGVFSVLYLILLLRPPLLFPNVVKDVVTGGFFKMLIIVLVLLKNGASCFRRYSSSASHVLNCVRNYCSVLGNHR
jgi:hypothetical protein